MRQIKINKYEGNTHYSVSVIDSYGKEHHLGYYKHIYTNKVEDKMARNVVTITWILLMTIMFLLTSN
jgi:hypothetical protein